MGINWKEVIFIFTQSEEKLLESQYFNQIRKAEDFYELLSKNTKQCWLVKLSLSSPSGKILLFHKHSLDHPHYHKQNIRPLFTVKQAIELIQSHDAYVLSLSTYTNNL